MTTSKQGVGNIVWTVVALCATVSTSQAEDRFFAGISIGSAKYDLDSSRSYLPAGVTPISAELDDSNTAMSFGVGYRFNRYLGLEASYVDLGDVSGKETASVSFPVVHQATAEHSFGASGPALTAFAVLPLGKFEPYLKAGVMFSSVDLDVRWSEFLTRFAYSKSSSSTETIAGLGLAYPFAERLAFRLDWTRYLELGDADTGEVDVDALSAGVQFRF